MWRGARGAEDRGCGGQKEAKEEEAAAVVKVKVGDQVS